MTTSNDATPKAEATTPLTDKNTPSNMPPSTSTRRCTYRAPMVIALLALSGAMVATYTSWNKGQDIQQLISRLDALNQQAIHDKKDISNTVNTLEDAQAALKTTLTNLDKTIQSSLQQHSNQTQDWILLSARYYLELAQINAHWSDDTKTTLALLQQATRSLATIHDQRVFAIRQAIAKEIAEVQATPTLDVVGLLSQLDTVQNDIAALPLKSMATLINHNPTATNTTNPKTTDWQTRLKNSLSSLQALVIVRHHDENIVPLSTDMDASLLRERLRLNLQEAQWALLQTNDVIFQWSLGQAIKTIQHDFEPNAVITKTMVNTLRHLQQTHLIPQKIVLNQSLLLINQLIESNQTNLLDTKATTTEQPSS